METLDLGRRGFVGGALAAALLAEMRPESKLHGAEKGAGGKLNLYFGDLHNHNAVGYAKGSLALAK